MSNKRQHDRVDINFALSVRDSGRVLGAITDISEGGMRVKLDGDIGENLEVREWTGRKGIDNKEFILTDLVGESFDLSIHYLAMKLGQVNAKLIRVIRSMNKVYFAMQFVEPDPAMTAKMMAIVKRRAEPALK